MRHGARHTVTCVRPVARGRPTGAGPATPPAGSPARRPHPASPSSGTLHRITGSRTHFRKDRSSSAPQPSPLTASRPTGIRPAGCRAIGGRQGSRRDCPRPRARRRSRWSPSSPASEQSATPTRVPERHRTWPRRRAMCAPSARRMVKALSRTGLLRVSRFVPGSSSARGRRAVSRTGSLSRRRGTHQWLTDPWPRTPHGRPWPTRSSRR